MSSGTELVGGRIPGERIATDSVNANSSTFTTTETQLMSVTAPLVDGRTYRVRFLGRFGSDAADDKAWSRIREDNTSGTVIGQSQVLVATTSTVGWGPVVVEAEYTASATANKTFVVTGVRNGGTGNLLLNANTGPALLYVEYISG